MPDLNAGGQGRYRCRSFTAARSLSTLTHTHKHQNNTPPPPSPATHTQTVHSHLETPRLAYSFTPRVDPTHTQCCIWKCCCAHSIDHAHGRCTLPSSSAHQLW